MIKPTYYIYEHRRADTGEVFYVGKGTRTENHKYQRAHYAAKRNTIWRNVVAKADGYTVEIIADFFSEHDCFAEECRRIEAYGRKVDGGQLVNLTKGGDGHSGLPISQAARAKLVAANSGKNHPNWGKKLSPETCEKKSASMKASDKSLLGKKLPAAWVANLSAAKMGNKNPMHGKTGADHPNSRKIIDAETGLEYASVTLAAEAAGVKMKTLYNYLNGHRPNTTSMRFK